MDNHSIDLPSPAFSASDHYGNYPGSTPRRLDRFPSYAAQTPSGADDQHHVGPPSVLPSYGALTPSGAEDRHGGPLSVSSSAVPVPIHHKFAAPMTPSGSGNQPDTPRAIPSAGVLRAQHSMLAPTTPFNPMTPQTPVQMESGITPQLQNIVATINLGCRLDLKKIAQHARNAEYNPKRFAAVIMRIREPRTTALIFSSGKMVCTGAKSEDASKLAARKYARIIQKLDFQTKFTDFKIQNMVGSCDVKFNIRLEGLVLQHSQFCSYEPELFPGLIYRMVRPRVVLLIFVSGKVVLTGAKVREEIYEAFESIFPILKSFKKSN